MPDIHKGLAGVVADVTAISKVNPETNSLLYRGYPVHELAATQSAEAVAYLLWNGDLPTDEQLAALRSTERAHRALQDDVKAAIDLTPLDAHPMDEVRTAVSVLGARDLAGTGSVLDATGTPEENLERSIRLFAALPAIVAYGQRRRRGEELIAPRDDLDYAANFLWMTFGEEFDDVVVDAFNRSMILYAEHSFNASTFTARVITSTLSDLYSAVVGAIGFLLMVLFALLGDAATHWTFTDVDSSAFLQAPSADHWFGTTQGGRDVYAMVVEGTRKSMMIGVFVALLQTGIAAVIGSSAAYFGGWWEKIALWATDLLLVVPSFLIIAILSQRAGAAKGSIALFIILLAGFGWMLTARVVRSLTLSVKNLEYVNAARFMNVPSPVIIARHILPNIASLLIVDATINVAYAVISETTLSYFGFGVQPPNTSLGTLIAEGQRSATTYPWIFLAPAAVLVLMLLCVNVMGDGLRDAIDPSSKSGGKA